MAKLEISVDAQKLADLLNKTVNDILPGLRTKVQQLSVATHAFIVHQAQEKLSGNLLEQFLGPDNKNVRWTQVGDSMWVVEIDQSVAWIEEGRTEPQFMDWLLTKNPKAKVSKKGTLYARIPISNGKLNSTATPRNPALAAIIKSALKENKIPLKKIEKNPDGTPKLGVLHRISPQMPGPQSQFPTLYSEPRSQAMAELTGLPAHGGISLLQDTLIVQRKNQKGKVVREAITFRTITEAHKKEGRWFAPPRPGLHSIKEAHDWASQQVETIIRTMQDEIDSIAKG
jgi:hypothetical protein